MAHRLTEPARSSPKSHSTKAVGCSKSTTVTFTDASQVWSLASSCETYSGDLEIVGPHTIDLTGVETVVGQIKYSTDPEEDASIFYHDVEIHSSSLRTISHGLDVFDAEEISRIATLNISLPALESLGSLGLFAGFGELHLSTNPELVVSSGFYISPLVGELGANNLYLNFSSAATLIVEKVQFPVSGEPLLSASAQEVECLESRILKG